MRPTRSGSAKSFIIVHNGAKDRVDLHADNSGQVLALTGKRPNVLSAQLYDVPLDIITAVAAWERMSRAPLSSSDRHETVFANTDDHTAVTQYVNWIQTGRR